MKGDSEKRKWYFLIAVALIVGAIIGYFATNSLANTGQSTGIIFGKNPDEKINNNANLNQGVLCSCTTPSSVSISCSGNNWSKSINGYYFSVDIKSYMNTTTNTITCMYGNSNDVSENYFKLIEDTTCNVCSSIGVSGIPNYYQDSCNQFCNAKLFDNSDIIERINKNLQTCVDYFESQCSTDVTVSGDYNPSVFSNNGWFANYGICQKSPVCTAGTNTQNIK